MGGCECQSTTRRRLGSNPSDTGFARHPIVGARKCRCGCDPVLSPGRPGRTDQVTLCHWASRPKGDRTFENIKVAPVAGGSELSNIVSMTVFLSYNQNLWMHHLTEGRGVPSSLTKSKKRWRWNAGEEGTPMLRVHVDEAGGAEQSTTLDELVAEGARRMLAAALEAEVDAYVTALSDERDEAGHRLVVRNGDAVARSLVTGAGPIEVRAPRVDDRRVDEATGEKMRFRSSILPPWARNPPRRPRSCR